MKEAFKVQLAQNADEKRPGMLGRFSIREQEIVFIPRLPLLEGKDYRVLINGTLLCTMAALDCKTIDLQKQISASFSVPKKQSFPLTTVQKIYPSSSEWPANLLKFYIHFSAPIALGEVYPHIRLLDEEGEEVAVPFLEIPTELWDPERKRLTIWFDPGRIKSHLRPNLELGSPLEEGKQYTIVIDSTLKDMHGQPLASSFQKNYITRAADGRRPKPEDWRIKAPTSNTLHPLTVYFFESMDHGVLSTAIQVVDAQGEVISGRVVISEEESQWSFSPFRKWKPGLYQIRISEDLEDLAGNNLQRLFDRVMEEHEEVSDKSKKRRDTFVVLDFEVN